MERDALARQTPDEQPPVRRPRGGARRGAGRPRLLQEPRDTTIRVEAEDIAVLRHLGNGNASAGVRRLIADARANNGGIAKEA